MSLNKPAFESATSTDAAADSAAEVQAQAQTQKVEQTAAAETQKVAEAEAVKVNTVTGEQASTSAVTVKTTGSALAMPSTSAPGNLIAKSDHLSTLEGQMRVTWEHFETINATQGQFQAKGEQLQLGDDITLHLISTQPLWVSSNGDTESEGEGLMLYSDDGVNASENSTVYDVHVDWLRSKGIEDRDVLTLKEHQQWLKENDHDKAHVQHKLTLVGELTKCNDKGIDLVGNLVQVSLPDTGRRSYESHRIQSGFHIARGRMNATDVEYVRLTAKQAGTGKKVYTQVKVGYAEGHGPSAVSAA